MRLIDIDRLQMIDDHIHYRKEYEGSVVLMNTSHRIERILIRFSIEYKPIGEPIIEVKQLDQEKGLNSKLLPKIINKISKLDKDGVFAELHRK